ncbi:MAG: peptidase M17, partial [Bacteroidetes bacterium]
MKVSVTTIPLAELEVDLLLIPVAAEQRARLLADLKAPLGSTLERAEADFTGEAGESLVLYPEAARARRVALLGMGPAAALDAEALRRAAAEGAAA